MIWLFRYHWKEGVPPPWVATCSTSRLPETGMAVAGGMKVTSSGAGLEVQARASPRTAPHAPARRNDRNLVDGLGMGLFNPLRTRTTPWTRNGPDDIHKNTMTETTGNDVYLYYMFVLTILYCNFQTNLYN
jgi:hypothetical protein